MLNSLIMLQCNGCDAIFEQHAWAEGNDPDQWLQALSYILMTAGAQDWLVRRWDDFHVCPDCALDGVCPG